MKSKIGGIFLIMLLTLGISGCGCKTQTSNVGLKLEVWGVNDDSETYADIFRDYPKINPKIKEITYRKFSIDTYKKELVDALASGKGPDVFMIHNTWTPSFMNKIVAAPAEVLSENKFRIDFADVAQETFIKEGKVYAVPLSIDSLALYYNKDYFNEAGITAPPKNWDDFIKDVDLLTRIDANGEIIRAGVAMGTAYNVNRSIDILSLLMLQNQTEMTENGGAQVIFDKGIRKDDGQFYFPGQGALNLYTSFARSDQPFYSWNANMHYSIDAFAEGGAAMMISYAYNAQTIRSKSPKLNFSVAPVPQMEGYPTVNFANFWGFAVAQNKIPIIVGAAPGSVEVKDEARVAETWKFLKFLATQPDARGFQAQGGSGCSNQQLGKGLDANLDPAKMYLEKTKKPAARKDLIEAQKDNFELGVFAKANLSARSWTQNDPEVIEPVMAEMIDQVNRGKATVQEAINIAVSRINKSINR